MFTGLFARVRAHAAREPWRRALTFAPIHLGSQRVHLTYRDVVVQSERIARVLARRLDPGDRALILLPATPEFASCFLGCLAAGVVAVPVPPPLDRGAQQRVLKVARHSAVSVVLSLRYIYDLAGATDATRQLRDEYEWLLVDEPDPGGEPEVQLPTVSADDIAFLQYTSGSTASPRGVMVSHRGLLANEAAIAESFGVTRESAIVSWLPLHHDMGLIGAMLQPLYVGARAVIVDPVTFVRRPVSWLETISAERADISGGPNFAYDLCVRKISAQERAGLDLSCWRVAFNGAAQVFSRTMRSFSAAFRDAGFRASAHTPCYGLAEATLLVASADPTTPAGSRTFTVESLEAGVAREAGDGDEPARELVSYRLPAHATVRVVDRATAVPVGEGRIGEIVVAGPCNGSGYWGDPAASAATFGLTVPGEADRPFVRTGDLGFIHRGSLHVVGRSKDLIVHRGRNLHPADLEAEISRCDPDVRPGCGVVFGVEHDGDEAVVVCQEVRDDAGPDRHPVIASRIRAAVAAAHGVTASTVVLLPPHSLTKTSSGKVQRQAAKRRYLAADLPVRHASTAPEVAAESRPADGLARRLARIARARAGGADRVADPEVRVEDLTDALCDHLRATLRLATPPRGDDPVAALGMDSLWAAQLQYEIEGALGVVLRPSAALRATSIAALAREALDQRRAPTRPATPTEQAAAGHGYELNAAQRALWFLHRARPGTADYNVTRAFRLTGDIHAGRLAAALDAVVARHPSLRLGVTALDGEPRAVVRRRTAGLDLVDGRAWTDAQEAAWYRTFATTPFDLKRDSLVRAALLDRSGDRLLVLSLHHIVCDVASLGVVVDDLARAYRAPDAYAREALPAAVSPAAIERAVLGERGDELAAYWTGALEGELPVLSLPRTGAAEPGRGDSVTFEAGTTLTAALSRFARESGLTLHNVLLTAYQVLLSRLSGQRDLLVGVPTAGRGDHRLARYVGYLVNVLPIRSCVDRRCGFAELARRTQQRMLDALDHQELPLAEMIRLANPDRASATATIFQAMFAYYSTALPGGPDVAAAVMGDPDSAVPFGDGVLRGHPVPDFTAQSDVCLNVAVRKDDLAFQLQYDPERVSRGQVDRLASTFTTLLAAVARDPSTLVGRLPLLAPDAAAAQAAAAVGPHLPRPGHYLDSMEQMVARYPDRVAVDDGAARLTYAELDARANHVATELRDHGLGVDGNVVVCARRSVDYVAVLLGIHKADGCYVPLSPTDAPHRAADLVTAVAPVVAVADRSGCDLLAGAGAGAGTLTVLDLSALVSGSRPQPPARVAPRLASSTIIRTSGSTGIPKAAVSTNAGVTNHMWQMVEHFGLGPDDCVAQTAPVSFDISVWQMLTSLIVGGRVRVIPEPESLSPASLVRTTATTGVTMLELVPSQMVALLDAGLGATPGALRVMLSTGEALTADATRRWVRELPHVPLHNAYGPAECTDDVTAGLCASGPEVPMTVSIGRPLANTSVHVLDDDLAPVPPGVVGTLHVGGTAVGRGYHGDPRRTAVAFVPDPWSPGGRLYRTGDLARVTAAGDLEFLGRADSQIKIRGQRVEVAEVEEALRRCPGVVEAAVKVHHGPAGPSLVGFVASEGAGGAGDAGDDGPVGTAQALGPGEDDRYRAVLSGFLPRYMIPTVLVRVSRMPRTRNGKVDYRALRYHAAGGSGDGDRDQFDEPLPAVVRSIWADLLQRDAVADGDSFFQLGGHSLLALTMIDRVGQALGVQLELDSVFRHPRLRDFVGAVRRADPAVPSGAVGWEPRPVPSRSVRASAAQQRFWFLREKDPDRPTYNMPGVLRMSGVLVPDALEEALRETLASHPLLLARFSLDDGALTWTPGAVEEFVLPRLDLRGPVAELGEEVFTQAVRAEANRVVDLRIEPAFRATLARLGPKDWALFVVVDHIACDGWSLSVFLGDLAAAYNSRVRGAAPAASAPSYSFADYCHEEHARRGRTDRDALAALWRDAVAGPIARSPLPVAEPPPRSGAGRHTRWMDEKLTGAVRGLAGRVGTTPYLVFATALSALVHSVSDTRETVLLGTLVAQRDRPEWRRLVGPLLNVSVLAVPLATTDTVAQALTGTRDAALRAYRSVHVPFQELAPLFPRAPGGDGSPFEVMLVMQPPSEPVELDGLTTDLVDLDTEAAPYPLTVDIEARDGRYRVSYRYAADRHRHSDVEHLALRLDSAVRAIVAAQDQTLAELRADLDLPAAERGC